MRSLLLSLLPLVAFAQEAPLATGPAVGAAVPDFKATAANGNGGIQTLKSIMGPKGALLVFFRSADW